MNLAENLLKICMENKIEDTLRTSENWEEMYHLSSMRQNLLEWYEFRKEASLLEVGSEAGALTGFFSKVVKSVVSLEADAQMAEVNKERNTKCSNVEIRVGGFEQVLNEKFDYITLIGTIEYAFKYDSSNSSKSNPFQGLLSMCKEHLKENGVLILALDNKTGMKYWAGAPEHCTGTPYAGITNERDANSPRTFSKDEIEAMLDEAGLSRREFYYPTPDYRFVSSMYSDEYLPQAGELRPGNMVYKEGGYQFFEEDLAYDTVCRDGKYPYFAESFLIFAEK